MSILLDASAILNLCSTGRLDPLLRGKTIPLAYCEVGNAIWKQVSVHRHITLEEGLEALDALYKALDVMEKTSPQDPKDILELAAREGLTYYDASYIHTAKITGSKLVTDDETLRMVAEKYVEASNSEEI